MIEQTVAIVACVVVFLAAVMRLNVLKASRHSMTWWRVLEVLGLAGLMGGCAGSIGEWFLPQRRVPRRDDHPRERGARRDRDLEGPALPGGGAAAGLGRHGSANAGALTMLPITIMGLLKVMPRAVNVVTDFIGPLNQAMAKWDIASNARVAAFLAQAAHESAELTHLEENLNYSAEALVRVWPKRFTAEQARGVRAPAREDRQPRLCRSPGQRAARVRRWLALPRPRDLPAHRQGELRGSARSRSRATPTRCS
jgi:hypothetical protein